MGRWMARAGAELLGDADLLIPIPLHRLRLASRRFNQSAALARVISRESAVPMETMALERVKPTAPQVGLTRPQRAANLSGAFRVDKTRAGANRRRRRRGGRRRSHHRRHGQRRRAGAAEGRRRPRRSPRFRADGDRRVKLPV
jgi:hypothetical protein